MSDRSRPFEIRVADDELADLARRLAAVRWPEMGDGSDGWGLGTNRVWLEALVDHWRRGFDWRAREDWLATRLPGRIARVRGVDLHFSLIPARASEPASCGFSGGCSPS